MRKKTVPHHRDEGLPRTNKLKYVEREYKMLSEQ